MQLRHQQQHVMFCGNPRKVADQMEEWSGRAVRPRPGLRREMVVESARSIGYQGPRDGAIGAEPTTGADKGTVCPPPFLQHVTDLSKILESDSDHLAARNNVHCHAGVIGRCRRTDRAGLPRPFIDGPRVCPKMVGQKTPSPPKNRWPRPTATRREARSGIGRATVMPAAGATSSRLTQLRAL